MKSSCRADGVDFQLSLDDFADSIDVATAETVFQALNDSGDADDSGGGKKK